MPNKSQFKTHEDYLKWYRDYRKKHRKKFREYNRIYNNNWRKENGYHSEIKWKQNNPEKVKAQRLLNYAVRVGLVEKKPCSICNNIKSQAHHEDYLKPLDVIWFCALCHKHHHLKSGDK